MDRIPKLLEKSWNKDFEPDILESWKHSGFYVFDRNSKKPVFSIDTPPPYINTPVHIGHTTTYSIMDMIARFKRMSGFEVLFPLGLDKNGLPIEIAAEKRFKKKLSAIPRAEAIQLCQQVLQECSLESINSFFRCGISFNSWTVGSGLGEIYETDSASYRALTQSTFIDMWKKGLIYEETRINNWCPGCQTTLADAEIEYADISSLFSNIIFKVKETGEQIIIGTTRPELVCSCGMVIFNPADERYKHLDGKIAITPLFNKEVFIRAHPLANIDKGTGLVMMCSAGDISDIRFFREMNLTPVIAINKDGTMNENSFFLSGLSVKHARLMMIEKLKENSLLVDQREIIHRTPVCERSKDPIEFIAMPELYVKQIEFKEKMLSLADQLNVYDAKSRQLLIDWISAVSIDWPISRRRFYGTEVPLWYCAQCHFPILASRGKYVQPWREPPPIVICPKCKSQKFIGDSRVLDTWFDSSISPLYVLQWSRDDAFFNAHNPCTLRPQGKEIVRTWLYYTILKCYLLTGKLIFSDAWIHHHIVTEDGQKMSKSKGNSISPESILDKFGAEPYRLWATVEGNLERADFRCSFERIDGASKTIMKLWNVARFVSMFQESTSGYKLSIVDKWIIGELNKLIVISKTQYAVYDFHNPVIAIRHFLWEVFAAQYIELVKNRAYNIDDKHSKEEQFGAIFTLNYCLDVLLKLLAPVIPLITYKLYRDLRAKDVHAESFPEPVSMDAVSFTTEDIVAVNSFVWKAKKEAGLSLRAALKELYIPYSLSLIVQDLKEMHCADKVELSNEIKVVLDETKKEK